MRGRHVIDAEEYFNRIPGTADARRRARLSMEVVFGLKRVKDVCEELDICSQRLDAIRWDVSVGCVAGAELGHAGRPRKDESAADAEIARLKAELAEANAKLQAALVRAELAEGLPRLAGKKR
jgi:multidrug resistance efflux pump